MFFAFKLFLKSHNLLKSLWLVISLSLCKLKPVNFYVHTLMTLLSVPYNSHLYRQFGPWYRSYNRMVRVGIYCLIYRFEICDLWSNAKYLFLLLTVDFGIHFTLLFRCSKCIPWILCFFIGPNWHFLTRESVVADNSLH